MSKWFLLLCGLLFSASMLKAGEPDEGGIGGTGVIFDVPDIPEISDMPGLPDVPDYPEVPGSADISVGDTTAPVYDVPIAPSSATDSAVEVGD